MFSTLVGGTDISLQKEKKRNLKSEGEETGRGGVRRGKGEEKLMSGLICRKYLIFIFFS